MAGWVYILWHGGCSLHKNFSDLEKFVSDYYCKPESHLTNSPIPRPGINSAYYVKVDNAMYARISEGRWGIRIENIEELGSFAKINEYRQIFRNKLRFFLMKLV